VLPGGVDTAGLCNLPADSAAAKAMVIHLEAILPVRGLPVSTRACRKARTSSSTERPNSHSMERRRLNTAVRSRLTELRHPVSNIRGCRRE
jgi:hypothetical protein